ncbi:MAG: ABC transporter permease [Firmicutes bacterium]|nr:ABC transporter permease [[Eubacterium] siraeum]MCM1487143.1 ABC transporter permease [Bacillota bacterium]
MVFKAYLRLVPSYIGSVIMYVFIFSAMIAMVMVGTDGISSGSGSIDGFSSLVAVRDLDGTEESRALISYLEGSPNINLVDIDFDRENAVQDSLYYRKAEYVLTINKGFAEGLRTNNFEGILSSEVLSGTTSEMFVGNEIDSYMGAVKLYIIGGHSSAEACAEAAKTLQNGVEIKNYTSEQSWNEDNKPTYLFYNYIPYVMTMMILGILVPTFSSFFNDEMRGRTLCSPISPSRYMVQVIAGAFVVCLGSVAAVMVAGISITKGTLFNGPWGYAALQMFIFMLFCLALSALVGLLCSGKKKAANYVTSIVSNILGLGMSFLCGIFVKQSLLGEAILNVGKFFPAYWYVRANNMIFGGDGAVFDEGQIWTSIGIETLFAAAVLAAALLAAQIIKGRRSG